MTIPGVVRAVRQARFGGQLLSVAGPDGEDREGRWRRKKVEDSDGSGSDCLDHREVEVGVPDSNRSFIPTRSGIVLAGPD